MTRWAALARLMIVVPLVDVIWRPWRGWDAGWEAASRTGGVRALVVSPVGRGREAECRQAPRDGASDGGCAVQDRTSGWVPAGWRRPRRIELGTGHHLRPARPADVDLVTLAVTGSQERLWSIFGARCSWPAPSISAADVHADLVRCAEAMDCGAAYTYLLLDLGETEVLGGVSVAAPRSVDAQAATTWWVVDALVGGPVEAALARLVPRWLASEWPSTGRHL